MAYIDPEFSEPGTEVNVLLFGETIGATVCPPGLFDSNNNIPRGIKSNY